MSKNKCAFIIPIHPPHYKYAQHIIQSLVNADVDYYFIFTTKEDKNNLPYYDSKTKYIILEDYIDDEYMIKIKEKNVFAMIKKLLGLYLLYNRYDYISCIDCEVAFLNKNNFYNTMKQVDDAKVYYGGVISDKPALKGEQNILNSTLYNHTPEKDHEKMKSLSQNGKLYIWWSLLPVFDCKKLYGFLEYIGFLNIKSFIDKTNWFFFEAMMYNYYCCLYHDYEIIILDYGHSLEFANTNIIEGLFKIYPNMKLGWINKYAYCGNKPFYNNNNDFAIVFHLDRTRFPSYYNNIEEIKKENDDNTENNYENID